jgi:hypothetical protein
MYTLYIYIVLKNNVHFATPAPREVNGMIKKDEPRKQRSKRYSLLHFPCMLILLCLISSLCLLLVKPDQLEINEGCVIFIAVPIAYHTCDANCWYSNHRMQ